MAQISGNINIQAKNNLNRTANLSLLGGTQDPTSAQASAKTLYEWDLSSETFANKVVVEIEARTTSEVDFTTYTAYNQDGDIANVQTVVRLLNTLNLGLFNRDGNEIFITDDNIVFGRLFVNVEAGNTFDIDTFMTNAYNYFDPNGITDITTFKSTYSDLFLYAVENITDFVSSIETTGYKCVYPFLQNTDGIMNNSSISINFGNDIIYAYETTSGTYFNQTIPAGVTTNFAISTSANLLFSPSPDTDFSTNLSQIIIANGSNDNFIYKNIFRNATFGNSFGGANLLSASYLSLVLGTLFSPSTTLKLNQSSDFSNVSDFYNADILTSNSNLKIRASSGSQNVLLPDDGVRVNYKFGNWAYLVDYEIDTTDFDNPIIWDSNTVNTLRLDFSTLTGTFVTGANGDGTGTKGEGLILGQFKTGFNILFSTEFNSMWYDDPTQSSYLFGYRFFKIGAEDYSGITTGETATIEFEDTTTTSVFPFSNIAFYGNNLNNIPAKCEWGSVYNNSLDFRLILLLNLKTKYTDLGGGTLVADSINNGREIMTALVNGIAERCVYGNISTDFNLNTISDANNSAKVLYVGRGLANLDALLYMTTSSSEDSYSTRLGASTGFISFSKIENAYDTTTSITNSGSQTINLTFNTADQTQTSVTTSNPATFNIASNTPFGSSPQKECHINLPSTSQNITVGSTIVGTNYDNISTFAIRQAILMPDINNLTVEGLTINVTSNPSNTALPDIVTNAGIFQRDFSGFGLGSNIQFTANYFKINKVGQKSILQDFTSITNANWGGLFNFSNSSSIGSFVLNEAQIGTGGTSNYSLNSGGFVDVDLTCLFFGGTGNAVEIGNFTDTDSVFQATSCTFQINCTPNTDVKSYVTGDITMTNTQLGSSTISTLEFVFEGSGTITNSVYLDNLSALNQVRTQFNSFTGTRTLGKIECKNMTNLRTINVNNAGFNDLDVTGSTGVQQMFFNGNRFGSAELDKLLNQVNAWGTSNYFLNYSSQTTGASPTIAGSQTAYNNLLSRGWTIFGNAPA